MTTVNKTMATVSGLATTIYSNDTVALSKPVELIGLYNTEHDSYRLSDSVSGFFTVINKQDKQRLANAEIGEVNGVEYVIVKVEPMISAKDIKARKPLF